MESDKVRIAEVLRSIQLAPRLRKAILKGIGKGDLDDGFTAREIYRNLWTYLSERVPLRKTSVSGSSIATAYHSFGGEVEALNTPTIRRLTPSCRHQLSALARHARVRASSIA